MLAIIRPLSREPVGSLWTKVINLSDLFDILHVLKGNKIHLKPLEEIWFMQVWCVLCAMEAIQTLWTELLSLDWYFSQWSDDLTEFKKKKKRKFGVEGSIFSHPSTISREITLFKSNDSNLYEKCHQIDIYLVFSLDPSPSIT